MNQTACVARISRSRCNKRRAVVASGYGPENLELPSGMLPRDRRRPGLAAHRIPDVFRRRATRRWVPLRSSTGVPIRRTSTARNPSQLNRYHGDSMFAPAWRWIQSVRELFDGRNNWRSPRGRPVFPMKVRPGSTTLAAGRARRRSEGSRFGQAFSSCTILPRHRKEFQWPADRLI